MYKYRKLKSVPQELRPREKLARHGAEDLSEEELLAVLLGSGTKDKDVLSLSRDLIKIGWTELEKMSLGELMAIKGLGRAKALQIKALLELSKRIREPLGRVRVLSPEEAHRILVKHFSDRKEVLVALYLDLGHRVLGMEVVAIGSLNRVYSEPKDILRPAVEISAYGIIVAHNHPQGFCEPSRGDVEFTERLKQACQILGLELIDHIIFDRESYFSFREKELL